MARAVSSRVDRTAEGGVIRFERHLPYPVRDVWDAITDPARLADWWLPFEPVDTGCVLRLSHYVTDTGAAIDNCYVVGLHTSFVRLAPCLAGRPVTWDWDGLAEAHADYATIGLAPPINGP